MVAECESAHAGYTMIGHVFMVCKSCVRTLWEEAVLDPCVALWSRFFFLKTGVGGAIAGMVRRVARSWMGIFSWVGGV